MGRARSKKRRIRRAGLPALSFSSKVVKYATLVWIWLSKKLSRPPRPIEAFPGCCAECARAAVTAHGKPVARLVPAGAEDEIDRRVREAAKQELLRRLERQPVCDIGRWTRDELYER